MFFCLLNKTFVAVNCIHTTSALRQITLLFSLQGQRLEIRLVPTPHQENAQLQAPAQRTEKTLRELNEMDPYDFAVRVIDSDTAHNFLLICLIHFYSMLNQLLHGAGPRLPLHRYYWPPHSQCLVVVPILQ